MCCTVYEISQSQPDDMTALTSSSDISASQDNIPNILDILAAISDDKSLAIFRVIAEALNAGADSHTIRIKLSVTHNGEYYHRLAPLIQNRLIIGQIATKNILSHRLVK